MPKKQRIYQRGLKSSWTQRGSRCQSFGEMASTCGCSSSRLPVIGGNHTAGPAEAHWSSGCQTQVHQSHLHEADSSNEIIKSEGSKESPGTITVHRGRNCFQAAVAVDQEGETAGDCRLSKSTIRLVIYMYSARREPRSSGLPSAERWLQR